MGLLRRQKGGEVLQLFSVAHSGVEPGKTILDEDKVTLDRKKAWVVHPLLSESTLAVHLVIFCPDKESLISGMSSYVKYWMTALDGFFARHVHAIVCAAHTHNSGTTDGAATAGATATSRCVLHTAVTRASSCVQHDLNDCQWIADSLSSGRGSGSGCGGAGDCLDYLADGVV